MGPFEQVVAALNSRGVRFAVIGVSGANYYAISGSTLFVTADRDLYLPPDPVNALAAWDACESVGLELWSGPESKAAAGRPKDRLFLATHEEALRELLRGE